MIQLLEKVLDRLIELLKIAERRREKRFQELWEPTYNDLEVVHGDYLAMVREVASLLTPGGSGEQTPDHSLDAALAYVKERRVKLAPVRGKIGALRDLGTNNTITDDLMETEQAFLRAVTRYISASSLPGKVTTPSAELMTQLEWEAQQNTNVPFDVVTRLSDFSDRLEQGWMRVSSTFMKLRLDLIQKST